MKLKYYFLISLLLTSFLTLGQDLKESKSIIKLAPLGLINKARIGYEHTLGQRKSFGTMFTFTSSDWPSGIALTDWTSFYLEPFIRFYLSNNSLQGLYVQPMVKAGIFLKQNSSFNSSGNSSIDILTNVSNKTFFSTGAGLYFGYQIFIGKERRVSIDLNVGLQYWLLDKNAFRQDFYTQSQNETNYRVAKNDWYETINGQSSVVSSYFTLGYKF